MAIRPIRTLGDPVLRQKAKRVSRMDDSLLQLFEDMVDTMRDAPGVGLAAPQVGLPIQLAVIEDEAKVTEEDARNRERQPVPFHVIINPTLFVEDPGPVVFYEGCLSLTGYAAEVPRAKAVRVEAFNEKGEDVVIRASGWYARILQHEIDHLLGNLYIDRMNTRTFREA